MPSRQTGTITSWNMPRPGKRNAEGFGFVTPDGIEQSKKTDLFVYADSIRDSKLRSEAKLFGLRNGQRVSFNVQEPRSNRHESGSAVDVEPLRDEGGGGGGRGGGRSRSRSRGRRRS